MVNGEPACRQAGGEVFERKNRNKKPETFRRHEASVLA
jgi:hypothetical protein